MLGCLISICGIFVLTLKKKLLHSSALATSEGALAASATAAATDYSAIPPDTESIAVTSNGYGSTGITKRDVVAVAGHQNGVAGNGVVSSASHFPKAALDLSLPLDPEIDSPTLHMRRISTTDGAMLDAFDAVMPTIHEAMSRARGLSTSSAALLNNPGSSR
jgi:hypothetical protein